MAPAACPEMGDELLKSEMGSIMEQLAGRSTRILRSQVIQTGEFLLLPPCEGKLTTRENQLRQLADSDWWSCCWAHVEPQWVCNAHFAGNLLQRIFFRTSKGKPCKMIHSFKQSTFAEDLLLIVNPSTFHKHRTDACYVSVTLQCPRHEH